MTLVLMSSTITTEGRVISCPITRICETRGPVCWLVDGELAKVASPNQQMAAKKATPDHSRNIDRQESPKNGSRTACVVARDMMVPIAGPVI